MHLSIQFGYKEYSKYSLQELELSEGNSEHRDDIIHWKLILGDIRVRADEHRAFSCLYGKSMILPYPKSTGDVSPFGGNDKGRYVSFILELDSQGKEIEHTCDPGALSFDVTPHYLTAVSFQKQVLDKYYQSPGKYEVSDGILRCGRLWDLQIDNHHEDKVCVWLGDLGYLAFDEQLHWRANNIVSETGVSVIYRQRQSLNKFADPIDPVHVFRRRYEKLRKACEDELRWQILKPLKPNDDHHLKSIRVPATDEQMDFDALVLSLTKILIESLNHTDMRDLLPPEKRKGDVSGIDLLRAALDARGVEGAESHIEYLQKLQELRSTGTAHRKGDKYAKISRYFGANERSLKVIFTQILDDANKFLCYLINVIKSGRLTTDVTNPREEIVDADRDTS